MTFKELLYCCTFPEYGAGPDGDLLDKFHYRVYMDNLEFCSPGSPVHFEPNIKNRKIDRWLADAHSKGIKVMWCAQGKLNNQNVAGTANKVMPIEDGLDALDPNNWSDYAELCKQIAIRYSSDATGDGANVFKHPSNNYFSSPDLVAAGTLGALQIGNEVNFLKEWHKGTRTITPEEYAACFFACYYAIRSVSQTLPIVAGSILDTSEQWLRRFLVKFESLCWNILSVRMPTDFCLSWHWYMRENDQSQGSGADVGASPEYVEAWNLIGSIDSLVSEFGLLGHYCTETGWSDDPADRSIKQRAPMQEGYSLSESVGLLLIRFILIAGNFENFKGLCVWAPADGYDGWPYWFCGLHYKRTNPSSNPWNVPHPEVGIVDDWLPKPSKDVIEQFRDEWLDWDVVHGSLKKDPPFSITLENKTTGEIRSLQWVDGSVADGGLDGLPKYFGNVVEPIQPPIDPTLKALPIHRIENFNGTGVTRVFNPPMVIYVQQS